MAHYGHMTQVGGGSGDPVSSDRAGWFLWIAMASFTFLLKSLSSLISTFTSGKVYLWHVMEVCSVVAELGRLPSVCCLNCTPSVLAVCQ